MIPRPDMVCISSDASIEEINNIIIENQYTRYPVYEGSLDKILGFIHIKDIYPLLVKHKDFSISSLLREPIFVPETMPVDNLAVEFKKHRFQMAVVIDEFGGTSGLVTHEDVMEEILGEVQDEFDEEEAEIKKLDEKSYEVCGKMRLDEFCEYFNIDLSDEDINTIGGYFIKNLGRIAEENDSFQDEFFKYCVTKTESGRIISLKIENVKS